MLVDVVIPSYNRALFLRRAISSIYNQYPAVPTVVHVVDDCSTDHTEAEIIELYKAFPIGFIDYIRIPNRCGAGPARNIAMSRCRGDFIAFLDTDDYYLHNHFAECLAAFKCRPELLAVHTQWLHSHLTLVGGQFFDHFQAKGAPSSDFPNTNCWFFRSSLLPNLKPFPIKRMGEDFDFFSQIRALDSNLVRYLPATTNVCCWTIGGDNVTFDDPKYAQRWRDVK